MIYKRADVYLFNINDPQRVETIDNAKSGVGAATYPGGHFR